MIIKLLADVYEAFAGSVRIAGIGLRTLDREWLGWCMDGVGSGARPLF